MLVIPHDLKFGRTVGTSGVFPFLDGQISLPELALMRGDYGVL